VGAPATPEVSASTVVLEEETENKKHKNWMILITGLTENLSGTRSGRAGLKEEAE
jgi:hypothetical protein